MATPQKTAGTGEDWPSYTLNPDALNRIAERNRDLGQARRGKWGPNKTAIAQAIGMHRSSLQELVRGRRPLTSTVMARMVHISGMDRPVAEAELFDLPAGDACADSRSVTA